MMGKLRLHVFGRLLARRDGYDYGPWLRGMRREIALLADRDTREELQIARLREILAWAWDHSPFYRQHWQEHGFDPARFADLRDMAAIPPLEKRNMHGNRERIIGDGVPEEDQIISATGGTTGNSFSFCYDRACFARRAALTILGNEACGWNYGDTMACIWNAYFDIPGKTSLKSQLREWLSERRSILDATHIDEDRMALWVEHLRRTRPRIVYGYANSVKLFAEYLVARGLELPSVRRVVTTAEPLYEADRATVARAFDARIVDRYASREHGLMGQEDEGRALGYFANSILIETDAPQGSPGDILVTDFWNRGYPFIRYRIGDTSIMGDGAANADGLPSMGTLAGRVTDFLIATDGSSVSGMSFHDIYNQADGRHGSEAWHHIQFGQLEPRLVEIRIVPSDSFRDDYDIPRLQGIVRKLLGQDMEVRLVKVDDIARSRSGKYRFTVNEMEPAAGTVEGN